MTIESTLRFLEGHLTLYYAGIDSDSLPFSEGQKLIQKSSASQIAYLKALALVADYIVIPPSFYFFWANTHRKQILFSLLLELYKAGIVISPIYTSMNIGTDFLDQKLSQESSLDRGLILRNRDILIPFFREMPVLHRDVLRQSGGYRDLFSRELPLLPGSFNFRRNIEAFIFAPQRNDILLSREQLHTFLSTVYKSQQMTTNEFRRYFYAANRSYYQQGAFTYAAVVSLLGAERYSVLGGDIFHSHSGILIAYDPLVVLGIFESLGISRAMIANLATDDLITIRKTTAFAAFRDAYHQFALSLQELASQTKRMSQKSLLELKSQTQAKTISRFFLEGKMYLDRQKLWNVGEMSFFAIALGITGFFLIPLVGALLGAVPIIVYGFGLTPRLSDYVISKLAEKQLPFYVFIRELKELTEHMKAQQENPADAVRLRR